MFWRAVFPADLVAGDFLPGFGRLRTAELDPSRRVVVAEFDGSRELVRLHADAPLRVGRQNP